MGRKLTHKILPFLVCLFMTSPLWACPKPTAMGFAVDFSGITFNWMPGTPSSTYSYTLHIGHEGFQIDGPLQLQKVSNQEDNSGGALTSWTMFAFDQTLTYDFYLTEKCANGSHQTIGPFSVLASDYLDLLSVSLSEFSAKEVGYHNLIEWRTEDEEDHSFFELERSEDGIEYTPINIQPSKGNTQVGQAYFYQDHYPLNRSYYRLRMVADNGQEIFSEVVVVARGFQTNTPYSLYPVPGTGQLTVKFFFESARFIQIDVYDALGRATFNTQFNVSEGTTFKTFNLKQGRDALYYFRLFDGLRATVKPFVISK